ncbi:hypothetical protein L6164_023548 [Bauhinia variegata]|uniref:Uncharacterized protein n=1 Tax=Bauhinia variegata TaxID=167791 RepID=A0ACB9MKK5_BAUVA|nr:hypothetical protein L6164_023548 [Bauhinia variegata]
MSATSTSQNWPTTAHRISKLILKLLILTSKNFAAWHLQVVALLEGLNPFGYVDGTLPCPSSTITVNDATVSNLHLLAENNKVLSFTVLSLGPSVKISFPLSLKLLLQTLRLPLSGPHLTTMFANKSKSRVMSLKDKLAYTTRGSKYVSDYLHDIKSVTHELALISHPLDDVDLVIHALNGLGSDFKEIRTTLKA